MILRNSLFRRETGRLIRWTAICIVSDMFHEYDLTEEEALELLEEESIGIFATVNEDGTPHAVPMHYLIIDGNVYMQSRPCGRKISNVQRNPTCSLAVIDMHFHIDGDRHRTGFQSAVFKGRGRMIEEESEKMEVLGKIYRKQRKDRKVTPELVSKLGLIEIVPEAVTGKHRDSV